MCIGNMERKESPQKMKSTVETSAHVRGAIHTSVCVSTSSVDLFCILYHYLLLENACPALWITIIFD